VAPSLKLPIAAAAALAAAGAFAQAAGTATPERQLAPVTVTVNRGVEQAAFDTPASVDVIDGATLRNGQLQVNLSETLSRVPGLVAQNRQNYAQDLQISSRGFGARSTFGVRGIRLYVDGIPASGPDGQGQVSHFDLPSASRVEVLRGPFSALYGNSSGGVISVFTEDGGPDTVVHGSTAFGSDGVQRHNARVSGQQGIAQYNLSATRFETDGWRDHSAAQRTTLNGKVKLQLAPSTKLTLVGNSVEMPDVQDPLGLTRAEFAANPRQVTPAALTFDTRKSVRQQQLGVVLDHRFSADDSVQLTVYGGERTTRQFQSIPVAPQLAPTHPGGVIDLGRRYDGVDARWIHRTRWFGLPATVTAGLALDEVREDRRGFQNFVGATLGVQGALRRDEANRARASDQYVQAQWELGERWSASAGLRRSRVRMSSSDRYIAPGNVDDSGSVSFGATTPVAGLVYHASDALNLYASVGRGFETPTLNEVSYRPGGVPGLNFGLRAATSRQWEVGAKAMLGSAWRVNVALFEARTADEIVVLGNAGGRSVFQNAGATKRQGLEASVAGTSGPWFTNGALTLLDARYRGGSAVPSGNRLPGVPATTAFVELGWRHRPAGFETALEWRHVGRVYVDDANSDAAGAATTLNVRLALRQAQGRWTVSEFIRIDNVANRRYAGSVIVNEANGRFFEPAPGRTWLAGLEASYRF
jgi:iron complex outermembrane receptor protein